MVTGRTTYDPGPDWKPTQAVDDPVINNPYDEPLQHWLYSGGVPALTPGRRRAMYWFATKRTGSAQQELFAEEESDDLPLVNRLRGDVKRWRNSGYRGASAVTKDLLHHWASPDLPRPLFFCQREAVETIIYLLELAIPGRLAATGFKNFELGAEDLARILRGERPEFEELLSTSSEDFFPRLVDEPGNGLLPLRRLGCKMATGSGKTVVMAMLIAWAFCNRGRNPSSTWFPNAVLVCAPNLTVRSRLQVLRPEHPQNYFDEFEVVPPKYRDLMNTGKVFITNWHYFAPKSEHSEGGVSYKVVNKGEETAEAFAKDRLGDLATRAPILVLNDEGHHCWRPSPGTTKVKASTKGLTKEEAEGLKSEEEEARVWLAGLDKINNSGLVGDGKPCILAAVDLSATPFYLDNSGYPAGSPFPWLVSDFGLVDAIESGIVKVPRLPVRDDTKAKDDIGRPDPKYFRLWRKINEELKPKDKLANGRPKPDVVYREAQGALVTLAGQWKTRFDEIRAGTVADTVVPPVMIVVCDNTDIAQVFYEKISGERQVEKLTGEGKKTELRTVYEQSDVLPEFANTELRKVTVRIDSKLLDQLDTEEGQTRDEATQALRDIIGSVGQKGKPGEQVRCVVSVSMLTEGWDATNVTHVLGVRAFGSQLLCEQVVGRGLRRMSYTPDPETGRLPAEYVDVYGIPFSLIPFKGGTREKPDPPPYKHVYAVPERKLFEIRMPVVESYTYALRGAGIRFDWDKIEPLRVDQEPTTVYVTPTRGYQDEPITVDSSDWIQQTREQYYQTVRMQQLVFRLAQIISDDIVQGASSSADSRLKDMAVARHQLFPEIVGFLNRYIDEYVTFAEGVDRRELGLQKYANLLRERVRDNILPAASTRDAPLLPIVNSYKPFASTADVNYRTTRKVMALTKSHLNLAVIHSKWESDAVDILEDLDCVECFTPNDRNVGLAIPYEYQGNDHRYEPDFVARLANGTLVMLEIKGRAGEIHDEDRVNAKNAAARKWVVAVNNARRFGHWEFEICRDLGMLRQTLQKYVPEAEVVRPFEFVDPRQRKPFVDCVPLTTLRAAAGAWSEEQLSLDPAELASDWVTFKTSTKFEQGMFVARIQGDSMEPKIPNGSYCLFRRPPEGTRQGRIVLVRHSGIEDDETGGEFTVKVYTSEKTPDPELGWAHTRVILKPLNPKHAPIELTPEDEDDVQVIAEFVEVVTDSRQDNH